MVRITSPQAVRFPSRAVREHSRRTDVLHFPQVVREILGRKHPRVDALLLKRDELLTTKTGVGGRPLILIDVHYRPEHEIREDATPYTSFANAIQRSGVLTDMTSVLDLGCATGRLLEALREMPNTQQIREFTGVDIFGYHGSSEFFPAEAVRFAQADLRFPIETQDKEISPADLVICAEVGEHIDPASLDMFLDNLVRLTQKRLVLTWSRTYPPKGAPPQHVSPLRRRQVYRLMNAYGFQIDKNYTRRLTGELKREKGAPSWWREGLSVWSGK